MCRLEFCSLRFSFSLSLWCASGHRGCCLKVLKLIPNTMLTPLSGACVVCVCVSVGVFMSLHLFLSLFLARGCHCVGPPRLKKFMRPQRHKIHHKEF